MPNLAAFIEALPKLIPRYYTISSSSLKHPRTVHVTASVVTEAKTGIPHLPNRLFKGVCTHHMSRLEKDSQIYAFVRHSTFKLPEDSEVPLILIGPGTGLAPMRAFLQEREVLRSNGNELGNCVLFFGCRKPTEDYIYSEELQNYLDAGILTNLFVAFSRISSKKVYVQHLLQREQDMVWEILQNNGCVYICGGTQMGKDVQNTFEDIIQQKNSCSKQEASEFLEELMEQKRYIQELWS